MAKETDPLKFVIKVPADQAERVIDALCAGGHWSEGLERDKLEFAHAEVARMVTERVMIVEQMQARAALEAQVAEQLPLDLG